MEWPTSSPYQVQMTVGEKKREGAQTPFAYISLGRLWKDPLSK